MRQGVPGVVVGTNSALGDFAADLAEHAVGERGAGVP